MKGVSDMDAQKNKKKEGNKNEAKKPIQVLHISKKDTKFSRKEKFSDNNQGVSKELKTEIKPISDNCTPTSFIIKVISFEDKEIVPSKPLCSGEKPKY